MPDNFSLNDLFKAGIKKDQFKTDFDTAKNNTEFMEEFSIFDENLPVSADDIFSAVDRNNDGTIDEKEISLLKEKFQDDDDENISENDIKMLYMETVLGKYGNGNAKEMYQNAMADNADTRSSHYVENLQSGMDSIEGFISKRQAVSTQRIAALQNEIDELVSKNASSKNINTQKYNSLSDKLKSMRGELDDRSSQLSKKERELQKAQNESKTLQKELKSLKSDPEKNKTEIEGIEFELSTNSTLIESLTAEISDLKSAVKQLNSDIKSTGKEMSKIQASIAENDSELSAKIKEKKAKIKAEEQSAKNDIKNYQAQIEKLQKAADYAVKEIQQKPAAANEEMNFVNTGKNLPCLNGVNYSAEKGQKLAAYMKGHSVGFIGKCSRYVSNGIAATGLGTERAPSACMMDSKLRNNKNFQEIKVTSKDQLKSLPAGCIVVYEAGAREGSRRYNATHGHIEVTLGNGTACSDGITRNMRYTPGQMSVFVPVA